MKSIQEALEPGGVRPEEALPAPAPGLQARLGKKAFQAYCGFVFRTYCPMRVTGAENLPHGSHILCSNHCSHMDSVVLMTAARRGFDNYGLIAAKDYFFSGKSKRGYLHYLMNLIPVERQSTRESLNGDVARFRKFVESGERSLIIYPEGTRSRNGELQLFKKGAAMIAMELGLPIVPVHIQGTYHAWPKGTYILRPSRLRVAFGKPLYPQEFQGSNPGDVARNHVYRRMTEALRERVGALAEER